MDKRRGAQDAQITFEDPADLNKEIKEGRWRDGRAFFTSLISFIFLISEGLAEFDESIELTAA